MGGFKVFGFLFYMLTLFIVGLFTFLIGFFPVDHRINQSPEFEEPSTIGRHDISLPAKQFSRTLLIIVDAMRYDFLNESSMPYAFKNSCTKLKLKVDIPTVTLPRVKSLIAGTLSSFADIVLNLGNSDQIEDSILHRISMNGDVTIFAGDHLWVDLFPKLFKRNYANMDSFFVNDFYEGDGNVTNAILRELNNTDWDMFVAHYLGLDHIGHVEGSSSAKILLKLREMDDIIKEIVEHENSANGFLLVTADHGMRKGGGHGGCTKEELYVPLLTFKKNCVSEKSHIKEAKQIDLTPTLAALLSSRIPGQSIGCIIPDLIQHMSMEEQLYAYHYNAMHLLQKSIHRFEYTIIKQSDYYAWLTSAKEMHIDFLKAKRTENRISSLSFERSKQEYIRASREMSNELLGSLAFFKYYQIAIGITLSTLVTINTLIFVTFLDYKEYFLPTARQGMVFVGIAIAIALLGKFLGYIQISSFLEFFIIVPISASIYALKDTIRLTRLLRSRYYGRCVLPLPIPVLACFLFQTCSLASSSFIEEEHQTWYYFGATLLLGLCIKSFALNLYQRRIPAKDVEISILKAFWISRYSIAVLIIIALLRRLNQTGDKWKHLEDFGDILNKQENIFWLSGFFGLGLIVLIFVLRYLTTPLQHITSIVALLLIYCYRGSKGVIIFFNLNSSVSSCILTCFWSCIAFVAILGYKRSRFETKCKTVVLLETNFACSVLISALLHKPHNVILLSCMILTLQETFRLCDQLQKKDNWKYSGLKVLVYKTFMTIILSKMFYFYQGNSNSLATIDLNPGYIGQSYNPLLVVILVTLNTYNAQINALLYILMHMHINYYDSVLRNLKKEQHGGAEVRTTEQDVHTVNSLLSVVTILPTTLYLFLLIVFRYHLFIYSVFAPKALYEAFNIIVFYLSFSITNLYLVIIR